MTELLVTVGDSFGQRATRTTHLEVVRAPIVQKFIDWWDGQFVRMRWYGTDYLVFVNSGWNEASFRQPITVGVTEPTPQFYRPTHSIIIEVWSAPGGKAKYVAGQSPNVVKDMEDTDGLWLVNYNLLLGTFYRWPNIPMPSSDVDPRSL